MLEITFWDVNHGNAAYIKTPNDRHIVVDLGDDGDSFSPLQLLAQRGIHHLDVAVITHPHRDHMDDIFHLSLLTPTVVYRPRHLSDEDIRKGNRAADAVVIQEYLDINARYNAPVPAADNLTVPLNFGGAKFDIFAPQGCEKSNLNNHSLVVVVSYARLKVVISGDNEAPSWKELLGSLDFLVAVEGADVFLASHHGRDAGYCAELFKAMGKPRLIVISDGRFSDTSATDRYFNQARGWTVYNGAGESETRYCVTTRHDGHITIKLGSNAQGGNYLNVTTSKPNRILDAAIRMLSGRP